MRYAILAGLSGLVLAGCVTPQVNEEKPLADLSCSEINETLKMSQAAYHKVKKANEERLKNRSVAGDIGFIIGSAIGGLDPNLARMQLEQRNSAELGRAPLTVSEMLAYRKEQKRRCGGKADK
jgi:hypothetical protein